METFFLNDFLCDWVNQNSKLHVKNIHVLFILRMLGATP
jgi:hypothetical protein